MPAPRQDLPDWTDRQAYAWLASSEPAAFAWEWLRRREDYCGAALAGAATGENHPREWGLHAFADPAQAYFEARPMWDAWRYPWVLAATASTNRAEADLFDLAAFPQGHRLLADEVGEHLLLTDGYHSLRLDVRGAPISEGPVALSYYLSGIRSLDRAIVLLGRLRSVAMTGRFASAHFPQVRRAGRLIQLLRAYDGLRCGATQADLAEILLSSDFERARWRIETPSLRSQAQRLMKGAVRLAHGGFWALLR